MPCIVELDKNLGKSVAVQVFTEFSTVWNFKGNGLNIVNAQIYVSVATMNLKFNMLDRFDS